MRNFSIGTKYLALSAVLCFSLLSVTSLRMSAQTQSSLAPAQLRSTLTIHVTGLRNAKGKVNVALYRDGKGFPSAPASAIAWQRIEIDPETMTITAVFTNLPQGSYAASVFHDEDLKGKMEYDAQGIPQQGYGLSNNPDTTQGPPSPEQGTFKADKPETNIEIKMVYWH